MASVYTRDPVALGGLSLYSGSCVFWWSWPQGITRIRRPLATVISASAQDPGPSGCGDLCFCPGSGGFWWLWPMRLPGFRQLFATIASASDWYARQLWKILVYGIDEQSRTKRFMNVPVWSSLVMFYCMSTTVGYSMPNPLYICAYILVRELFVGNIIFKWLFLTVIKNSKI